MSFSKYDSFNPFFTDATVKVFGKEETYCFEKCEDINLIALQSHHDKKSRQLSKALVRLAVREAIKTASKTVVQESLSKTSDYALIGDIAGLIVELVFDALANQLEKADLRQWYSLPHSIYYSRVQLDSDSPEIVFTANGSKKYEESFNIQLNSGGTAFKIIRTQNVLVKQ